MPSPYPVPSPRAFKPPRERSYWAAAAAAGALTVFDMEASLGRKSRCGAACQEANPVLRPFLRKGRLAAYSYQSLIGAAFGYAAWKARQSRHPAIRKAWWVPFLVLGWAHFVGGTLNATYEDGPAAARPRAP